MKPLSARKVRGGVSLHNRLTPAQRQQLAAVLTVGNFTYNQARTFVREGYGIRTSEDALARFYGSFAVRWQHSSNANQVFDDLMSGPTRGVQ